MRVTRKMLDNMFETVTLCAFNRGVDTSRWSFGKHVSDALWIAEISDSGGCTEVSARWGSNQEAYYGLQGMIRAYMTLPKVQQKELVSV